MKIRSKLLMLAAIAVGAFVGRADVSWNTYSTITGVDGKAIPAGTPVYFFATAKKTVADVRSDLYAAFTGDGLDFDDMPAEYEFIGETAMTTDGSFGKVSFPASKNGWTAYGYIIVSEGEKGGESGTFIMVPGIAVSGTSFNTAYSFNWSGTNSSGAGSFVSGPTLKANATAFLGAYDGTTKKIAVTVTKKPGDFNASIAYSYSGEDGTFVPEETFNWPKDVSDVMVFARVSYPDWTPVNVSAKVTITNRVVTVTAGSAQKEFDATPLTCGTFDAVGFIDGEGIESLAMTDASTVTEPGAVDNVIDESSVVLKDGTKASNYAITYVNGSLTVDKRTTGLGVTAIPYEAVYDGQYHVFDLDLDFTGPKTDAEPTILYSTAENGTYYETNKMSSFTIKNWQSSAKTLWAKVSYPGYEDIKVSSTVTILKRPVTVTADSQTWAYNGSSHTCRTYTVDPATDDTGFVGSEGISGVTINSSITNPGSVENVISSLSYKSGTTANNYDVKKVSGTLTVTPNEGLEATATGWTGFYNAQVHKITATRTAPSDYNTVTYTYSYDENGPFVADGSFAWPKNVTNVTVYAKVEQTGYVSKIVQADIVIKPRTVVLQANSTSKNYDGKPLTLGTFTVKSYSQAGYPSSEYGFTSGQAVTLSMTAESTITDPGTQPNEIDESSIKGNSSTILSNYIIKTESGTLTVNENPNGLRATGTSYEGFYDGQEHGVGVNVSQCPSGKTPTILHSLTGEEGSFVAVDEFQKFVGASDEAVRVYTRVELFGYKAVAFNNTVFIKKRAVTVTAASQTWVIDGEWHSDDGFTVSPAAPDNYGNGFIAGEGIESLAMTEESKIKELGTQPNVIDQNSLKLIGATDLANYNITWKNGTLTVRNPPYITWQNNTVSGYTDIYGADGALYNGKIYLIYSVDETYQASVVTDIANAFKSDAGLDLQKLGEIKAGARLLATAEAVDGKFPEQTVLMIPEITSADNKMHALRTLAISKGTDGKDYIYISGASQVGDKAVVTVTIQASATWDGPGHLASGTDDPSTQDWPEEWADITPDSGVKENFKAWRDALGKDADLTTDAAKNAFLMNTSADSIPALMIDSIAVQENGYVGIVIKAPGSFGFNTDLSTINGVLYVEAGVALDSMTPQAIEPWFDVNGKAHVVLKANFVRAYVGFAKPEANADQLPSETK